MKRNNHLKSKTSKTLLLQSNSQPSRVPVPTLKPNEALITSACPSASHKMPIVTSSLLDCLKCGLQFDSAQKLTEHLMSCTTRRRHGVKDALFYKLGLVPRRVNEVVQRESARRQLTCHRAINEHLCVQSPCTSILGRLLLAGAVPTLSDAGSDSSTTPPPNRKLELRLQPRRSAKEKQPSTLQTTRAFRVPTQGGGPPCDVHLRMTAIERRIQAFRRRMLEKRVKQMCRPCRVVLSPLSVDTLARYGYTKTKNPTLRRCQVILKRLQKS